MEIKDIQGMMKSFKQTVKDNEMILSENRLTLKEVELRRTLAIEELNETIEAYTLYSEKYDVKNYKEMLDGIIDQVVILTGTINTYGCDYDFITNVWEEIKDVFLVKENVTLSETGNSYVINKINDRIRLNIEEIYNLGVKGIFEGYQMDINKLAGHFNQMFYDIMFFAKMVGLNNLNLYNDAWNEVLRANLSKLEDGEPVYREDGKVTKGKYYIAPNLESVLLKHLK